MAGMNPSAKISAGRSSDFILHVYDFEQGVIRGRVCHIQSGRSIYFHSMLELILAIQAKMVEINYPQTSTAPRTWSSCPQLSGLGLTGAAIVQETTSDMMPEAILASFLLRVQFRQNASWQGTLAWMERKESCVFRSELELMTLIAAALISEPAAAENSRMRTEPITMSDV